MKKQRTGRSAIVCFAAAIALFACSLFDRPDAHFYASMAQKCERQLAAKQQRAAETGWQLCRTDGAVAADRAIYAFSFLHGQLQRWTTRDMAASDDELAAIDTAEQFLQLGHSWYVTRAFEADSIKIVTAVLIKRDYLYENDFLQPHLSPFLAVPGLIDVVPATDGQAATVASAAGKPLFTLVFDESRPAGKTLLWRWAALALVVAGLFLVRHCFDTTAVTFAMVGLLALLRYGIFLAREALCPHAFTLFSPSLYADSAAIPSLGSLLLHALFVFLMVVMVVVHYKKRRPSGRVRVVAGGLAAATAAGIHYVWRSLLLHSTLPLNLAQLDQLNGYTPVAYTSLCLLLAACFLWLYLAVGNRPTARFRKINIQGGCLIFIFAAALYALFAMEIYGHRKELAQAKTWACSLMLEHDPTAELYLNEIGSAMAADSELQSRILQNADADEVHHYLVQRYLQGYLQYYDLQLTICPHDARLRIDDEEAEEIDCRTFFEREIRQTGVRLSDRSMFYCLLNNNGRHSYIGALSYTDGDSCAVNVYLELDSKLFAGGEGYPELLLDKNALHKNKLPPGYSCAKYTDARMVLRGGDFRYPHDLPFRSGDKIVADGYVHLLFRFDDRSTVVVSRAEHTFWHLAILFSYLALVLAVGCVALLLPAGVPLKWSIARHTFKRKIATLLVAAFVISILCTAVGTVWYNIYRFRENVLLQMEEKMRAVLTQLDEPLNDVRSIDEADRWTLDKSLLQLSNSMRIDINIYDLAGRLVTSSRREVFEKQLQSTRLHRAAYEALAERREGTFVNRERIGNLAFSSVYAACHNQYGDTVAYINVPYFSKRIQDIRDLSALVTTLINFYLLALMAALLLGAAVANRLLRPLEIVRRHMQRLDVTKQTDCIRYDKQDELGDLIRAYNQMIATLEERTRKLAQSERESAWREMARQIAHEIKNPLTPMQLSIQHLVRLKKENAPGWPARFDELATALLEQIDTLAKTASEFSNFAKITTEPPVDVALDTLLRELKPLFDTPENNRLEWHFDAPPGALVHAHPGRLSRVLMNLLTNALQAVQGKPEGTVRITLAEQSSGYCVSIDDNGDGISDAVRQQLFTPNFTTKTSGSGLGLAISKQIIEHEGGRIEYQKSDLGGACFTVWLPKREPEEKLAGR
jgi:nitrogen fixation/metabolism regulation signal transduction histidine kinase